MLLRSDTVKQDLTFLKYLILILPMKNPELPALLLALTAATCASDPSRQEAHHPVVVPPPPHETSTYEAGAIHGMRTAIGIYPCESSLFVTDRNYREGTTEPLPELGMVLDEHIRACFQREGGISDPLFRCLAIRREVMHHLGRDDCDPEDLTALHALLIGWVERCTPVDDTKAGIRDRYRIVVADEVGIRDRQAGRCGARPEFPIYAPPPTVSPAAPR